MKLRVKQFNIISMHFFLKSSLFLIVFALISSGISVWFDGNRREISSQLAQSRQQQEMFRDAYERLWDEFFSLQKSKSSLFFLSELSNVRIEMSCSNKLHLSFKMSTVLVEFCSALGSEGECFRDPPRFQGILRDPTDHSLNPRFAPL